MLDTLTTVLWFIVALSVLVTIHEFGHFFVARRCGVKVLRFSVGFGKILFSRKDKYGTEFAISALPLGGYVKMLDEREMEVDESERHAAFNRKSVRQRMAIAAAGPIANFILAVILYWCIFLRGTVELAPIIGEVEPDSIAAQANLEAGQEIVSIDGTETPSQRKVATYLFNRLGESGPITFTVKYADSDLKYESRAFLDDWLKGVDQPDPINGLGLQFMQPPIEVRAVESGSAADAAGLKPGDVLLGVDQERIPHHDFWASYLRERPGERIELTVRRGEDDITLDLVPAPKQLEDGTTVGFAGVSSSLRYPDSMIRRQSAGFAGSVVKGLAETWDTAGFVLMSFKKLIVGEISTKNLSGPIGIAKVAADSADNGLWPFVSFLAHLSIVLGVLNLLPVPVLDGGHILFCIVEWISGKPVSERVQLLGVKIGLAMILCLTVVAFYNDMLRFIF